MTDERDEQEEMDSLNELGDEELEPILSEGEETDPNEGDEKASEDFDEPDEENPWEYSTRFAGLTDEEIVSQAQQHDDAAVEYLLYKYKNFVRSKARSYFLIGADHEDIVQEGMIGLYKAIRDYQPERLSSFRAFAELCITRQIITAIKTATRQKHVPLNSYVSLNKPIYDEESDRTLMDVIVEGRAQNPEDLIIGQEDLVLHPRPGGSGAFQSGAGRSQRLSGRQELSGDRRQAGPPREVHRQRPSARKAQAGKVPRRNQIPRRLAGAVPLHPGLRAIGAQGRRET